MSPTQRRPAPTEAEIDDAVLAQMDDDAAWDEPVRVRPAAGTVLTLPGEVMARAAFSARLHRAVSVDD